LTKKVTKEEKITNEISGEITKLIQEKEEYLNDLKRLKAEFENYMKRTEKERLELHHSAKKDLIIKLLEVIDNFERALEHLQSESNEIKEGIELIFKQLLKLLEDEGIKTIKSLGETFDPFLHEALTTENGEEDNKVSEELQKGYTYKDKVIRPSKVKITKKSDKEDIQNE